MRIRFAISPRLPEKSATTEEWLESIRREDAGRALVTGVAAAVDDEQTGGRSLISWDRYSDSSAVLACLLGPISPRPRHQSWEGTGTLTAPVPSPA